MSTQPQQIPTGWEKIRLPEIARIRKGLTYKSADYSDEKNGLVFVTLKCISKGGGFNKDGIKFYKGKYDQSNIVKAGDLIIANTDLTRAGDIIGAPLFMPHLSDNSVLISMDLSAIDIDKDKIVKQYLYYYLLQDGIRQFMRGISSGSTVLHLQLKSLSSLDVFLPPLSEQTRIATILSKVDEEIEKVERIIEQTEKLKKGLMQKLLTKGIGHMKFKKTQLGDVPEEWEVVKLEEIAAVERGKFSHRPRNDKRFYGGDTPFIQTGDIVNCNGKIKKYTQTLNEQGLAISRKFAKGTIVLTIAANIGDTGILTFESCFPDSLVGINVTQKMDNEFLEYYLRTKKAYLNKISTQSAQKNINLEKLRPLLIIKPPKNEQQEIARILNSLETKISNIQKIKSHLLQLKKGLMNDLLSGRVRINN